MKTNIKYLSLLLVAATACGDNKLAPDARVRPDTGSDGSGGFPAAPTLGTQIDRIGRPAVNTLLNHGFDPTAAAGSAKDAYNADTHSGSGWVAAWAPTLAKSIGIVDALDTGICGNGLCESGEKGTLSLDLNSSICTADCGTGSATGSGNGCGNSVIYNVGVPNPNPGTPLPPNAGSYGALAQLLAEDEIFLNTSRASCTLYLAVEYYFANGAPPNSETTCGGRALDYDVVDFSLSMISMGVGGFVLPAFTPKITDGAGPHTDYLADFPYLGNPH